MSFTHRLVALLLLLAVQADAWVFKQPKLEPSSLGRHLQHVENESDPATTDFLAGKLKNDQAEDLSSIAAFIDALVMTEATSTDPPFYSNWSTAIHHSDDTIDSDQDSEFEDVGVDFTPSPALSMTAASASLEQEAGSAAFNSSGELGNTVGDDVNMADGEAVPSSLAPMQLSSGIAAWIIAFALALFTAN